MKQRYRSINDLLKEFAGQRVYKVALDAGFGCPNRDSALSKGACAFCNERSYYPAERKNRIQDADPIHQQLKDGIAYVKDRHGAKKFIAYFQRGSNTYGPVDKLRRTYNAAIDHPDVVGLAISTRPDCISDTLCDALEEIASKTMLWAELGLQSSHDKTLDLIGRGHTVKDFIDAHKKLNKKNIPVCAHVILGLPGESGDDIIKTARFLGDNNVWGVKIHNLHVLKDTQLASMYENGEINLPTLEEYAGMVADFIEHLPKDTVVHRVNGHSPRNLTIAPEWSVNKLAIFNAVQTELEKRDTWQGRKNKGLVARGSWLDKKHEKFFRDPSP